MIDYKRYEDVAKMAQAAQVSTRCPAAVTLGQWALESGYGKYLSGRNNPFGIKWCKSAKRPFTVRRTHEFRKGQMVTVEAKFLDFETLQEAFEYHGRMLTTSEPYKAARLLVHDWKAFLHAIAPIYATDPKYEAKILSIIAANGFDRWNTTGLV